MRIVSRFVIAAALSLGASQASAQEASKPTAKASEAAVRIPATQLRYYCFSGPFVYSIGAVACLTRGQWGTCKWTGKGSNHSAPQNFAYWVASVAPSGACP